MYGLYSVIRYVKDVVRDEAKNIGIILVTEENKVFIEYEPSVRPEIKSYLEHLKAIDRPVYYKALYDLRHDLQNSIQITEPRMCAFEDVERCMQNLYELFVS